MTRTAWATWITFLLALAAGVAFAQQADLKRDQVAAATARAVDKLRAQIAAEEVGRGITVGEVLEKTHGNDFLIKTLQRSQMIGGPRWLDDQTCQVRLEISGPRVAAALVQIVNLNPKKSPIGPDVLAGRLKQWDNRTFCATSTSTGSTVVEQARPAEENAAWANVGDPARQAAIAAAKRNAIAGVILTIDPLPLTPGKTVADALADAKSREPVDNWLKTRPVTQVEFRGDLQVAVTIATPPTELSDIFLSTQPGLDPQARDRVHQAFVDHVPPDAHGSARVGEGAAVRAAIVLPAAPPPWVNDEAEADGSGSSHGSQLKAARAAEADAQSQLRAKVDALQLTDQLTVGAAAKKDPRIEQAIARTLSRVRAAKVDYQPDGSAKVRVDLDLHDLWDAISAAM